MFIKDSKIKKLVKKAYEASDLIVARYQEYWFIGIENIILQVKEKYLSNKIKAILVEHIGELPNEGEGYQYGPNGSQIHLDLYDDLFELYEEHIQNECEATCAMIRRCQNIYFVMQALEGYRKLMVNEKYTALIDTKSIDIDNGESEVGLPVWYGYRLMWCNNVMAISVPVGEIKFTSERAILQIAEDIVTSPDKSID